MITSVWIKNISSNSNAFIMGDKNDLILNNNFVIRSLFYENNVLEIILNQVKLNDKFFELEIKN